MNGLPYYKAYPRDFIEGTIGMPFELKAAYRLVLDLIYMQGGNLPDDSRYISGLLGCSVRKWNALREELIARGKLHVSGASLTNYRAIIELESLRKVQDKQRENRSRPNKIKDLESPRSNHTEPDTDTDIESKHTPLSNDKAARARAPIAEAIELWNETAERAGFPKAKIINDQRRKAIKARLNDCGGLDGWKTALAKAEASSFCRGGGSAGWVLDLNAFTQSKTFTKLMEGAYDDRPGANRNGSRQSPGHHHGRPRGFDAALAGVANVARQRGISDAGRSEDLDSPTRNPKGADPDWWSTGGH